MCDSFLPVCAVVSYQCVQDFPVSRQWYMAASDGFGFVTYDIDVDSLHRTWGLQAGHGVTESALQADTGAEKHDKK